MGRAIGSGLALALALAGSYAEVALALTEGHWVVADPDANAVYEMDPVGLSTTVISAGGSFRYPSYWHVRTYGLFAANPFGLHHFKRSGDVDGSHTLAPGESFTLRYRFLFHRGDEKAGEVAKRFSAYSKEVR